MITFYEAHRQWRCKHEDVRCLHRLGNAKADIEYANGARVVCSRCGKYLKWPELEICTVTGVRHYGAVQG